MKKEIFKILKEINSLETGITEIESVIIDQDKRLERIGEKKQQALEDKKAQYLLIDSLEKELNEAESQTEKITRLVEKNTDDLHRCADNSQLKLLESQQLKLTEELQKLEAFAFSALERLELAQENLQHKNNFLTGIEETLAEISEEVANEKIGLNQKLDAIRERIRNAAELLPKDVYLKYESSKKNVKRSPYFSQIIEGRCSLCKISLNKLLEKEVEEELNVKFCPSCSRLLIPKSSLY